MRSVHWYFCLSFVLMLVLGCGVGHVLAGEIRSKDGWYVGMGTPSDAETGTPSDAEMGTPSDAETGTPSDAKPDEIVLLMDIPDEGCRTGEELVEQLLDDSRSQIVLASDIEWSENRKIVVSGEKEVEMGEYSIHIGAESQFDVSGPAIFRGGGRPLFEVQGYFCPGNGVEIYAGGDNAVAVDIAGGGWGARFVEIHAEGRNARAVRFETLKEVTIDTCQIEAEGDGSRGIEAEGDLRLFLSSVSGGESAVNSAHGELLFFGSSVSPEPEQARVLPALFFPGNRLEENGFCVAAGSTPEMFWEELKEYHEIEWCFFSEGLEFASSYWLPASWSGIPEDFSKSGTYFAKCAPVDVPGWFPVELYEFEVPIHVVDPDRPFIRDAGDAGNAVLLRFFTPIRDAREIRVEYSMDDRKSWRGTEELKDSFVTDVAANVEPLEPNRDYWFRLVVKGGPMEGISNEILFIGDEVRKANTGGDRDHGDRDDQGEVPPQGDIIPPPDEAETGAEGAGGVEPGAAEPDAAEPDDTALRDRKPEPVTLEERMPDMSPPDDFPSTLAESSETGSMNHPSDTATAKPDHEAGETPVRISASGLQKTQETAHFPRIRLLWGLIPGIFALGGGVYVCWKKRKKNN